MIRVNAVMADGTEEAELLNVVDILKRAGADVKLVSIAGKTVTSSHGILLTADLTLQDTDLSDCDLLFVPGGMPGSKSLGENNTLVSAIGDMLECGKKVAAICAAPALVLGANGFLRGVKATCFPGFEQYMTGAVVTGGRVEADGNIITARGLGCAIELGLELVAALFGRAQSDEIKAKIQF
ncbi:MAG: DJ-1/PfpI family protein [Clostridiales bacterium]|nr:DJ-1/PfpI family protein [Clostridiales bacterium]